MTGMAMKNPDHLQHTPPTPTVMQERPNPDFEDWIRRYAAVVCAANHQAQGPGVDWRAIEPCEQHRWEARQIAYARRAEEA